MEKKDYNNFIKSMKLSHHWYYSDDNITSEIRYGLFVPSNELVIELMEGLGYFLLAEVINSCEYTKNVKLLYILTEYVIAKWKSAQRNEENDYLEDDRKSCLYASLRTIYRLLKDGKIAYGEKTFARILEDFNEHIRIPECQPIIDVLLREYFNYCTELSEESLAFIKEEESRLDCVRELEEKYVNKYISNNILNADANKIEFLSLALEEGMISIESDGTIKSVFFEGENDFQVDPDIVFMLNTNIQACIIKESIDEGTIRMIEGFDFLMPEKPTVKKY